MAQILDTVGNIIDNGTNVINRRTGEVGTRDAAEQMLVKDGLSRGEWDIQGLQSLMMKTGGSVDAVAALVGVTPAALMQNASAALPPAGTSASLYGLHGSGGAELVANGTGGWMLKEDYDKQNAVPEAPPPGVGVPPAGTPGDEYGFPPGYVSDGKTGFSLAPPPKSAEQIKIEEKLAADSQAAIAQQQKQLAATTFIKSIPAGRPVPKNDFGIPEGAVSKGDGTGYMKGSPEDPAVILKQQQEAGDKKIQEDLAAAFKKVPDSSVPNIPVAVTPTKQELPIATTPTISTLADVVPPKTEPPKIDTTNPDLQQAKIEQAAKRTGTVPVQPVAKVEPKTDFEQAKIEQAAKRTGTTPGFTPPAYTPPPATTPVFPQGNTINVGASSGWPVGPTRPAATGTIPTWASGQGANAAIAAALEAAKAQQAQKDAMPDSSEANPPPPVTPPPVNPDVQTEEEKPAEPTPVADAMPDSSEATPTADTTPSSSWRDIADKGTINAEIKELESMGFKTPQEQDAVMDALSKQPSLIETLEIVKNEPNLLQQLAGWLTANQGNVTDALIAGAVSAIAGKAGETATHTYTNPETGDTTTVKADPTTGQEKDTGSLSGLPTDTTVAGKPDTYTAPPAAVEPPPPPPPPVTPKGPVEREETPEEKAAKIAAAEAAKKAKADAEAAQRKAGEDQVNAMRAETYQKYGSNPATQPKVGYQQSYEAPQPFKNLNKAIEFKTTNEFAKGVDSMIPQYADGTDAGYTAPVKSDENYETPKFTTTTDTSQGGTTQNVSSKYNDTASIPDKPSSLYTTPQATNNVVMPTKATGYTEAKAPYQANLPGIGSNLYSGANTNLNTSATIPGSTDKATGYTQAVEAPVLDEARMEAQANKIATAAQGGAVGSAIGAGRSAGLSKSQSALLGAREGSGAYQQNLQQAYATAGQQQLEQQSITNQQRLAAQEQNLQNMGLSNQFTLSAANMSLENQKQFNDFTLNKQAQNLTADQMKNLYAVDTSKLSLEKQKQFNDFVLSVQDQNLKNMGLSNQFAVDTTNLKIADQKALNDFKLAASQQNLTADQIKNAFAVDKSKLSLEDQKQLNDFNANIQDQILKNKEIENLFSISSKELALQNQKQFNDFQVAVAGQGLQQQDIENRFAIEKAAQTLEQEIAKNNINLGMNQIASNEFMARLENEIKKAQLANEIKGQEFDLWGTAMSALSALLGSTIQAAKAKGQDGIPAYADGVDSMAMGPGESSIIGEHGPEIMKVAPQHSIIPNIQDGYEMLEWITQAVTQGKQIPKESAVNKTNSQVANTAMIAAVNDKLEKALRYFKEIL